MPNDGEIQPPRTRSWPAQGLEAIGLLQVWKSSRDTHLLMLQRFIRMAAYGATALIFVVYLRHLGISSSRIGLFMSATLFGDVVCTFLLALYGDRLGRRAVLGGGSLLMCASGVVFAFCENYWLLLAAAVFGVITPSGGDVGVFRVLEESTLAHLSSERDRASIYTWYNTAARAGSALGMMVCGWAITLFHEQKHVAVLSCYRGVFIVYAAVGAVKFVLCCMMSSKCEVGKVEQPQEPTESSALLASSSVLDEPQNKPQTETIIATRVSSPTAGSDAKRWSLTDLGRDNTSLLIKLCFLYAIDYMGTGMSTMSWIAYYFTSVFGLSDGTVGTIFFISGIIAVFTGLLAAWLARRLGNAKSMFYCMVPSHIAQICMGLTYSLPITIIATIYKCATDHMDSAPNSAFLAAAFEPQERTAIMGIVNVVKTLASSTGPTITGFMVANRLFWLVFVISGLLKATFEILRFLLFRNHPAEVRAREERKRLTTSAQE